VDFHDRPRDRRQTRRPAWRCATSAPPLIRAGPGRRTTRCANPRTGSCGA